MTAEYHKLQIGIAEWLGWTYPSVWNQAGWMHPPGSLSLNAPPPLDHNTMALAREKLTDGQQIAFARILNSEAANEGVCHGQEIDFQELFWLLNASPEMQAECLLKAVGRFKE